MIKSIKVQLKPNNKQKSLLFQSANISRWAYNWTLNKQQENYKNSGKFLQDSIIRKELTQLKKTEEYKWLNEVSAQIPKQAVKDCCKAYKNFFKGQNKFPKFKSKKKSKPSFYNDNFALEVKEKYVLIEKVGWIKLAEFNRIPFNKEQKYMNPRITYDGLNWWISVGIEENDITNNKPITEPIGIDLGIKDLAIISNGQVFKNINKTKELRRLNKKLKRLQRQVSRKYQNNKKKEGELRYKKTCNIIKNENEIRKVYKKISDIHSNYNHQITTSLVKANPMYIVIEDLNIRGMMKNKHLSKTVAQQCFYEFRRQLEYKCSWNNVRLIIANRWFPSSKTCSECGCIKSDLKLSDRTFICEDCGCVLDRDLNASINLKNYGKSIE